MKKENRYVSVIVPNRHSPVVDRTIRAVLKQKYQGKLEIIYVGVDKYGLVEQFKKNSLVRVFEIPKPVIPSQARNIGISKAKGEYLVFLDSDCIAQPGWLCHLLKNYHKNGDDRVVGGSFYLEKSGNFWRFCDNLSHFYAVSSRQKKKNIRELNTANLCVPRAIIKKVGKFNESLVTGEDKEYIFRVVKAGYFLVFEPEAKIIHLPERTDFVSILKHSYSWGQNSLKVRLQYTDLAKVPFFMKNRLTFLLMTPLIAFGATLKVFTKCWYHCLYLYAFPIIFASKIAWCCGALVGPREKDD